MLSGVRIRLAKHIDGWLVAGINQKYRYGLLLRKNNKSQNNDYEYTSGIKKRRSVWLSCMVVMRSGFFFVVFFNADTFLYAQSLDTAIINMLHLQCVDAFIVPNTMVMSSFRSFHFYPPNWWGKNDKWTAHRICPGEPKIRLMSMAVDYRKASLFARHQLNALARQKKKKQQQVWSLPDQFTTTTEGLTGNMWWNMLMVCEQPQSFIHVILHEPWTSIGETSELTACSFLLMHSLFFLWQAWIGLEPRGERAASGVPGTLGATYVACSCRAKVIRVILSLITWVNMSNIWALKHHHFSHSPHGQFRKTTQKMLLRIIA